MDKNTSEELACWYVQQVGAAIDAATGSPAEWKSDRMRERAARAALLKIGTQFAPLSSIFGFGHFVERIGGNVELNAAFVLHTREDVLTGTGVQANDVVDDGMPQVQTDCVGILTDGRAVRFYANLSVAQAIGMTPPDDNAMAAAVVAAAARGELEWWAATKEIRA